MTEAQSPEEWAGQRELCRLSFARFDMQAARELCQAERFDYWSLLTAVVVIYARPFTRNRVGKLGEPWTVFDDLSKRELHRHLMALRNTLFAHNDTTAYRFVAVTPPGSWGGGR